MMMESFFNRIGVDHTDRILLIEEEGITTISTLVTKGRTAGSGVTNKRLSLAISYLSEETKRLCLAPRRVMENIVATKKYTKHSWEMFLLQKIKKMNLSRQKRLNHNIMSEPETTLEIQESATSLDSKPKALDKLEAKLLGTNWKCNLDKNLVELCDPISVNGLQPPSGSQVRLQVPIKTFLPLFLHQFEGIERIISNYNHNYKGLILGDEMGLGKTRQVLIATFSLMIAGRVKRACAIVPPSLIAAWLAEAKLVMQGYDTLKDRLDVVEYSSRNDLTTRNKQLREKRGKGGALLVVASNCLVSKSHRLRNPLFPTGKDTRQNWDIVMVDEAHSKAKSKATQLGSALSEKRSKLLEAAFVILLTATPIQNRLKEFCSLLGLVSDDTGFDDFLKRNRIDIEKGQQKKACSYDRKRAGRLIEELQDMASPYVLQRCMTEHFKGHLPPKEEFVVWVNPSAAQWAATDKIIKSDFAKEAKASGNRFCIFAVLQRLRMVALHPFFVNQVTDEDVSRFLESTTTMSDDDLLAVAPANTDEEEDKVSSYLTQNHVQDIMKDSSTIRVCKDLLVDLTQEGHNVLVFCPYRKPLDFLGHVLENFNISFYRVDGQTNQQKRTKSIESFNKHPPTNNKHTCQSNVQVMLLTIGAGGLGLTLTGADRVILLGASWNPMVDAQAVGRAYRIGQRRPVTVYRILMSGLIDEKVYGKQVQKNALIREVQTETGGCLTRLFDDKELRRLLTLGTRDKCHILNSFSAQIVSPNGSLNGHIKVHGVIRHDAVYRTFSNRFAGRGSNVVSPKTTKKRPFETTAKNGKAKIPRIGAEKLVIEVPDDSDGVFCNDDDVLVLCTRKITAGSSACGKCSAVAVVPQPAGLSFPTKPKTDEKPVTEILSSSDDEIIDLLSSSDEEDDDANCCNL